MKRTMIAAVAAGALVATSAAAQVTSTKRIPVTKDASTNISVPNSTMPGASATTMSMPADTLVINEWYRATGTTCSTVDVAAARAVQIKTDLYNASTMISPDSAKIIALCAVPGQIGSGEMTPVDGRTHYDIDIIPNGKKTHTKVVVDAETGAVLSSKQFGGLRGLAGWVKESMDHKKNTPPE
jgi:hypothetical protein